MGPCVLSASTDGVAELNDEKVRYLRQCGWRLLQSGRKGERRRAGHVRALQAGDPSELLRCVPTVALHADRPLRRLADTLSFMLDDAYKLLRHAVAVLFAGDIARYSGFALCSGRLISFGLPAFVTFINVVTFNKSLEDQRKRYGADFEQYISKTPLLVPYTWPLSTSSINAGDKSADKKSH